MSQAQTWTAEEVERRAKWSSLSEGVLTLADMIDTCCRSRGATGLDSRTAVALFTRDRSNFRAAQVLIEKGFEVEAKILARACIESVFCLTAIVVGGDEVVAKLYSDDIQNQTKTANWINKKASITGILSDSARSNLDLWYQSLPSEDKSTIRLKYEDLARQGGLHDLYLWYRFFSVDAHPTWQSLVRYLVADDNELRKALNWEDDPAFELSATANILCHFLLAASYAISRIAGNDDLTAELNKLSEKFKQLSEESGH